jgi:AcrR family transcriptional regulator
MSGRTASRDIPARRSRGRPVGGGNTSEQAKQVLLDAAERSILTRGFQGSPMELIAHEAGYSRAAMYQHFPNRRQLLQGLTQRTIRKYQSAIGGRLPEGASLREILVESLVIVATELIHDPLLKAVAEQTEDGTIAHLIANDPSLPQLVEQLVEAMRNDSDAAIQLRPELRTGEVGQFIITTALAMLLGITPNTDEPESARRYLEMFVLPAILVDKQAEG